MSINHEPQEKYNSDNINKRIINTILKEKLDLLSPLTIIPEITSYEQIPLNISKIESEALKKGIDKRKDEPKEYLNLPKVIIDFKNKTVKLASWPLVKELLQIKSDILTPTGLTIGLISSDKQVIAIQRSENNDFCPGFLGTPAKYMTVSYDNLNNKQINIQELINFNVETLLKNEIGLDPSQYDFDLYGMANVDYPYNQNEFIVIAQSFLSSDNIKEIANKNNDLYIQEKKIINLDREKLLKLFDKNVPIANQHAYALYLASHPNKEIENRIKNIKIIDNNAQA